MRILVLGPVDATTRDVLRGIPGAEILEPAEAHELLSRIAADQPQIVVAGSRAVDWSGSSSVLHQVLDSEFVRATRYRHPLSVVLVAIDRVAELSATHGEPTVDRYRGALADTLRRSLRQIDVVARTDVNELAIVLPETTAAGARVVAERARVLASRLLIKTADAHERKALPVRASVSVGVCDVPREGTDSSAAFLASARAELARALGQGGDRVCVFEAS